MMILERFAYSPLGTFGRIMFNGKTWYTVERPWLDNKANISCIPEGTYTANRYKSPTPGRGIVWQLNRVPNRSFIQIHPGNTQQDVVGCIALGTVLGCIGDQWAVLHSKIAFNEFMNETAGLDEISILINQFKAAL